MPGSLAADLARDPAFAPLRRSLAVYYGDAARTRAMDALYARFLQPGELAFDIGSHVGDRIGSFRRLGARVVAVEPQPLCAGAIRRLYCGDEQVTLLETACGAAAGTVTLRVNSANPTVSTASDAFIRASSASPAWQGQVWDGSLSVACTTLDALIDRFGEPAFAKIDVEGLEDAVLAGLSRPLRALSFEFTTIQREVALRCLDRLAALGGYGFDVALGETHQLTFQHWVGSAAAARHIAALPQAANSGDVYCLRT